MGNLWSEPMTSSPNIQALVKDWNHKGHWQIRPALIQAWKRGDKITANMVHQRKASPAKSSSSLV